MNSKLTRRVRWGLTKDNSFFGMYAVHPVDDTAEYSPRRFWFYDEPDAQAFLKLMEKSCHNVKGA